MRRTHWTESAPGAASRLSWLAAAAGLNWPGEPRFDVVRTERLVMRRWREEDREPFAAMNADPEVMRRLGMTLHARFDHPAVEVGHPLRPHVAYRVARTYPV